MLLADVASSWIGTLPGWLTVAGVCVAGYFFVRGGGGTALRTLETANRILEQRVKTLEAQALADAKLIAELKARTDLSVLLKPVTDWTLEHEQRDQQRFERTLTVLDLVAARLGPDEGFAKMAEVLDRIAGHFDNPPPTRKEPP